MPAGRLNNASTAVMRWRTGKHPEIVARVVPGWNGNHSPEGTLITARRLTASGATGLQLNFVHHSLTHYIEQLEALAGLMAVIPSGSGQARE